MQQTRIDYDAIVQLTGGFGNQLFQYAFGTSLAVLHGRRVAYDIEFYSRKNAVPHNRLRLIEYGFDVPVVNEVSSGLSIARRLKRLPSFAQQALAGITYVKCPAVRYIPVEPAPGLTYFTGLWHSPRYFDAISEQIRKEFRSRLYSVANAEPCPRPGTVGLHVRRGDYLTHKQSQNLDYQAYFVSALSKLNDVIGQNDWNILVFTDDPDWCEDNLSLAKAEVRRGGSMLEDFLGLMECEHKIISNSTFAWWAGYLADPGLGLVLAPKRWHALANSDEAEILDAGWIVVEDI